jgi:hypothetical protein
MDLNSLEEEKMGEVTQFGGKSSCHQNCSMRGCNFSQREESFY